MTAKQSKKIEQLLNKSLLALQDAAQLGKEDYLLVRRIEEAKDALHYAIATSESSYAIANA